MLALGPTANATTPSPIVSLSDIIEMRRIDSLTPSPDGRRLAYRVLSPSLSSNSVAARWYDVDLEHRTPPVALGQPSEPLWLPEFDMPADGVAQWTPDGSALLVLEQARSQTQIHELRPGGRDRSVTRDAADVVSFALSADCRTLRFQVRASRREIATRQGQEEMEGVHFDRTVLADGLRLTRSFPVGGRDLTLRDEGGMFPATAFAGPLRAKSIPLPWARAKRCPAASHQPASLNPFKQLLIEGGTLPHLTLSKSGVEVALLPVPLREPGQSLDRYTLTALLPGGGTRSCAERVCTGYPDALREILASPDGDEAVLVSEADFSGRSSIYAWNPNTDRLRRIHAAGTSLNGGSAYSGTSCVVSAKHLICVESAALRPPRLVSLDLSNGQSTVLADPNVALANRQFPSTRFLEWSDAQGRKSSGILVLPQRQRPGMPLVITSYSCRGFLHGGTASLAPELLLAARGIAALCINHDPSAPLDADPAGHLPPLAQHKQEIQVYQAAISTLAKSGLIDPSRVGLSGHSYSAMVAAYAISHTPLFRVAAIGTGVTIDPVSFYVRATTPDGPGRSAFNALGLPPVDDDPAHVWAAISPSLNATQIKAPLLIQPPESEWLMALQLFTSIRDAGGTSDMDIYPGAAHMVERYPRQQASRALRSVDWFAFWLLGQERPASSARMQYAGWRALRASRADLAPDGSHIVAPFAAHALSQASTSTNANSR